MSEVKRLFLGAAMEELCLQNPWGTKALIFDDLHKTGIYTWDYFYNLGNNKFSLIRKYLRTLKKHGLSRDPPPRK